MYDLIFHCQEENIDGLILLVDFEKAFDSLSWEFIESTLNNFNFGEKYIFFKNSNKVIGIITQQKEHKLSQYADDTSVFLRATEENLKNSLEYLEWFYQKSGLKININKTKVIRIGPIRETDRRFCRENDLEWVSSFTALGIEYDTLNIENITELNIQNKIDSMTKLIQTWMGRNINPIGRVTVFKSSILSKIIHLLQSLPSPSKNTLKNIEKIAHNFIWRNKRHQVNRNTLSLELEQGGLNMIDLVDFDLSLKITWLQKLHFSHEEWEEFALSNNIDRSIWTGKRYHIHLLSKVTNPFWRSVVLAYKAWYQSLLKVYPPSIIYYPIWGNKTMNIPLNNRLYSNGLTFLGDIIDEDGNFLSKMDLETRFN